MKQLISNAYSFFLRVINNEICLDIISMIVVSLTSYLVAKYSASKPEKIRIKQLQLSKVYLPLFRLFSDNPADLSKKQVLALHKKITNILDSNYELVFPQLHRLVSRLKKEIMQNKDYSKTITAIRHQVSTDYELLKKSLGYPSESLLRIFIRMTLSQKLNVLKIWFYCVMLFIPMILICAVLFYSQNKLALIILTMIIVPLLIFAFIVLTHVTKHLDD